MKSWGLGKGGALLGVLLVLMSALVVLPQGAHAQGKKVWGIVAECATSNPVGATVTLVDVHAQSPDTSQLASGGTGFFSFTDPPPSYYKLRASPSGFTHFTAESPIFRFDGMTNVRQDICVDRMPTRDRWLNLTVVDAQPAAVPSETVGFQEFARGPENATQPGKVRFNTNSGILSLDTRPLEWGSETLAWVDDVNPLGRTLSYSSDYTYDSPLAFLGQIQIVSPTVWGKLNNTIAGSSPRGYLETTYTNVSKSSSLAHGQILTVTFSKDGVPMPDPSPTLEFVPETGAIRIVGNWTFGPSPTGNTLTASYTWRGAIGGAKVSILDAARREAISNPLTTNSAGKVFARVWNGGTFDVKVEADTYQTVVNTYTVNVDTSVTIALSKAWVVRVLAVDDDIDPIVASEGLTGVLINTAPSNPELRILPGSVQDNQVSFFAANGAYRMIVDANGKIAQNQAVTVSGMNQTIVVVLNDSPEELFRTTVVFNNNDWNDITVSRDMTLLQDSAFPGIPNANLRNVRWQLDLEFGTLYNGDLDAGEEPIVNAYLGSAGPFYTVTNTFFSVNGKTYKSNFATYTASLTDGPGTNLTVTSSVRYTLTDPSKPIDLNKPKYFVNVTTIADKNVTVYQNNSYLIRLPRTYEMTSRSTTGNVVTKDFVNVTVDPKVDTVVPNPRVNMIVERSLTGVARAEVEGPAGKVSVREGDQSKYLAWVANNTKIVFSANKTTDRLNQAVNAKDANFTWLFSNGTLPNDDGWGIWTSFNYTINANQYTVNLTVRQVGGNVTWRDIKVAVDNLDPTANIMTNKTGWTRNPPPYTINEDQAIRFFGNASTDNLYGTTAGEVAEWSWDFDSDGTVDGTGSIINWNYSKPGDFTATLFVKDFVGHRSANRTMDFIVRDVTPPVIDFVILDPSNEFREVTGLTEGHSYIFNASKTTDNSLEHPWDNVNLTYKWQWGDGNEEGPFTGDNSSLNRSHPYARFSSTGYKLNITATDAAGKNATLTRTIIVQANVTAHPDISVVPNTLKISPTPSSSNPQEGVKVTFTVNITNAKDRENATDLKVQFAIVEKGKDKNQTVTVTYIKNGTRETDPTLPANWTLTVEIVWTAPSPPGNYSLKIKVWDNDEPTTWVTSANEQSSSLVVREAGWKFWAIVGAFLFIVFGLPIIYYLVRKVRAGEITLRRRRGKEDEDEEEEEEEEDEDEEDEDRGGKKRL